MALSISETTRRRSAVAAATLAAIVGVELCAMGTARAQAQAAAAASEPNREAARAKLVEGVAALKRSDYKVALARFEEAYALVPSPKIHYDFGLAYVGLGRRDAAVAAFERFLAEAPDAPADKREKAASLIATLRAEVDKTAPADRGTVMVIAPQPAAPPLVAVVVQVAVVDQRREPAAPAVAMTADRDPSRTRRVVAVSLGVSGGALLTAGVVFGVLAQREGDSLTHDSQTAQPGNPTPFDSGKESRGILYERLQVIGLVSGAVAVAAGTALYVTGRRRAMVEPVAGPSLAGANLRVTF